MSAAQRSSVLSRTAAALEESGRSLMRMPRGTSSPGEAMMLQRSVESLAALVRVPGGLVCMPRNRSNSPRAGSRSSLARDHVSACHAMPLDDGFSVPPVRARGVARTPWAVGD
jgi:hypothetical protein